jgi:alanine dehydrogenase
MIYLFLKHILIKPIMLHIDHHKVKELLPMPACIEVMRDLFAHHCLDKIINPLRSKMWLPENVGVMGIMPAYIKALDVMGIKVISVFPDNYKKGLSSHQGQVLLFETETGKLLASLDGGEITAIRTAAVSGLMTELLARENASHLALIGTGELAIPHLEAMLAVRKIKNISVFSPRRHKMDAFADSVLQKFAIKIDLTHSIQEAVTDADIICTLTPSRTPILNSDWVKNGAHINAVGSSTPIARELESTLIAKSRLYVDSFESALNEAGDILMPITEGIITEKHILGDITGLLNKTCEGRQKANDITLFKSLGMAIEDVAAAYYIYQKIIQ